MLCLAFAGCCMLFPKGVAAQEVSLRNNLLYDATGTANLSVEVQVGDHVSVGATGGFKSWPRFFFWEKNDTENTSHWRHFLVVPEARYYFDEVFKGFFVGADFVYTHYNVGNVKLPFGMYPEMQDFRDQGSFWAGGAFAGYAWWPWQHWRIELLGGVAAGLGAYDRYDCATCGSKVAEDRRAAVVPQLSLNVAYNPVARDKRKRKETIVQSGTDTLTVLAPPVAFVVQLQDVQPRPTAGDKLSAKEPWVLPISQYRPLDYMSQQRKDSLLYVVFGTGSDALQPGLGQNRKVLDRVQKAVEALRDDPGTNELIVSIAGFSSIEGPQVQNDTLSVRRARALARELKKRTGIADGFFEITGKGEAWDWFREQVDSRPEGFTPQELEKLQAILAIPHADAREREIRSDGPLYEKVSRLLLTTQRNAGYIRVYYGTEEDAASRKLNGEIYNLLKARRYHDAVRAVQADADVMERVHSDPEAMNAYGIALYFMALDNRDRQREREAVGLLRDAARHGSAAAAENLKGIEVYGPARKEYEQWLKITSESNDNN